MKRRRISQAEREEMQREALGRATSGFSVFNEALVVAAFSARGIPEGEILPRVNVFTFHAWKAKGRFVRKGEHGVKVVTWAPVTAERDQTTGEAKTVRKIPRNATVFHITQTEAAQ